MIPGIKNAKNIQLTEGDIVLQNRPGFLARLYYILPVFIRMAVWRIILRNPKLAYKKMGNVAITSPGFAGKINGWFIHKSIHPVSFGIGSIIKKPVVINDEICIREILNMTVLIDHNVIDGAPMVRFLKDFENNIENSFGLSASDF